jgi:hypothetical protein
MLDRESDWRRFLNLISTAKHHDAAYISAQTEIGLDTVRGFMDQAQLRLPDDLVNNIPKRLLHYPVGFRYRRLSRWVMTERIKRARQDYDSGLVELTTGLFKVSGEDAWVLFAIPRSTKVTREPYFSAPVFS